MRGCGRARRLGECPGWTRQRDCRARARVRHRLGGAAVTRGRTRDKEYVMANWKAEVFENEYLAADATDVHAIVSIECSDAGTAGQAGAAAELIVVDTSGSMASP